MDMDREQKAWVQAREAWIRANEAVHDRQKDLQRAEVALCIAEDKAERAMRAWSHIAVDEVVKWTESHS